MPSYLAQRRTYDEEEIDCCHESQSDYWKQLHADKTYKIGPVRSKTITDAIAASLIEYQLLSDLFIILFSDKLKDSSHWVPFLFVRHHETQDSLTKRDRQ